MEDSIPGQEDVESLGAAPGDPDLQAIAQKSSSHFRLASAREDPVGGTRPNWVEDAK